MKQKLLARLVLGAIAGSVVMGVAQAGNIQSASTVIAREVITTDAQVITSPTVSYAFSGPVNTSIQSQQFQMQIQLGAGATWASAGQNGSIQLAEGSGSANPGNTLILDTDYTIDALAVATDDPSVLYVTITVLQGAGAAGTGIIGTPTFTIAAGTPAQNQTISKLKTVVGDIVADYKANNAVCYRSVEAPVTVRHYIGLTKPKERADGLGVAGNGTADDHLRGGQNTATLLVFPTNLKVNVTRSTGVARLDPAQRGTRFVGTADNTFITPTLIRLGDVHMSQLASGYDSNLTNQYLLQGTAAAPAQLGVSGVATAGRVDGPVEAQRLDVTVSASNGFVKGGSLFLATDATCATQITGSGVAITATNAAGPITVSVPTTEINAALGNVAPSVPALPGEYPLGQKPVHVCYTADPATSNAETIPGSSFFGVAQLVKAAAGVNLNEQDNICDGPLYALGGGIKIDVRNYANGKNGDGWISVVRLINNSEVRTIDVFGQLIDQDGKYGGWGKLATLAPRATINLRSDQIDEKLTGAPDFAAAQTGTAAGDIGKANGGSPRLRIYSENASTLRVQNYLYHMGSNLMVEASGAQAVDYEGTQDRAPLNEGQYQLQDAQDGIKAKR